ncbi:tRNA lysidine(34) synthetase TilS [Bacteroidota bacterium]
MYEQFIQFIEEYELVKKDQKILLAISGGIDSMVMLDLFLKSDFKIAIAHCNFKLREKESDEDAIFVKLAALNNQVPFHYTEFETTKYAEEKGISSQMAARELRYDWFQNICDENNYDIIATAHHGDDNIETFLTNLTRGTGIKGLTGIKEKSGNIIRPILFVSRKEIENYASKNKIDNREDSSNKSTKYYRNFIRHEIIPKFEKLNPDFKTTISETIQYLKETEEIYNHDVASVKKNIIENKDGKVYLSIEKLKGLNPLKSYLFEFLRPYQFSEDNLVKIIESLDSQPGKKFYSESFCLLKDREYLIIYPFVKNIDNRVYHIKQDTFSLEEPFKLTFEQYPKEGNFKVKKDENIAQLDFDKLSFPLALRKWQNGDLFHPLGMNKSKKLSDFFIDQKTPINQKENTWVITTEDKIVWIVGLRIDDRYKITDNTTKIVEIKI